MNSMRVSIIVIVAALLLPCSHAEAQSITSKFQGIRSQQQRRKVNRTRMVLRQMNRVVSQVDFEEEPLQDVLDWFREHGLKNIVVHWKKIELDGGIDVSTPITFSLANMTLGEILDLVLEQASQAAFSQGGRLFYHIRDGVIEISTRSHFADQVVVRTYTVEDLLQTLIFYNDAPEVSVSDSGRGGGAGGGSGSGGRGSGGGSGGRGSGGGGSGGGGTGAGQGGGRGGFGEGQGGSIFQGGGGEQLIDFESLREVQIEKLLELIKQIKPETWLENSGKGTITEFRGKLIIAQTVEMHEIIGGTFRKSSSKR